jgi:hypothetical protein
MVSVIKKKLRKRGSRTEPHLKKAPDKRQHEEEVHLRSAEDVVRVGWEQAKRGKVKPLSNLWDKIDAE